MRKIKNKIIISIIFSSIIISSISVFIPVASFYTNHKSNNLITLTTTKKYKSYSVYNNNNYNSNTLVSNLNYVKEYISTSVIKRQQILKLSILGGSIDKANKKSKKYKESNLASISRKIKHLNRYYDQTKATIDNSNESLRLENVEISKIIQIIKNHPYNYEFYLHNGKCIIPNIDFFINYQNLPNLNNLNFNNKNISNSIYDKDDKDTHLNSISIVSEEEVFGAKELSLAGSSLFAAVTKKVSFKAKIITFNLANNSYGYATSSSTDNVKRTTMSKIIPSSIISHSVNTQLYGYSSHILNNYSYFNSCREILSIKSKFCDNIPESIIRPYAINYLPKFFNSHYWVIANARVEYNHIYKFKHNIYLYSLGIGVGTVINSVLFVLIYKLIKYKIALWKISKDTKKYTNIINIADTTQFQKIVNEEYLKISSLKDIVDGAQFESRFRESEARMAAFEESMKYFHLPNSVDEANIKAEGLSKLRNKLKSVTRIPTTISDGHEEYLLEQDSTQTKESHLSFQVSTDKIEKDINNISILTNLEDLNKEEVKVRKSIDVLSASINSDDSDIKHNKLMNKNIQNLRTFLNNEIIKTRYWIINSTSLEDHNYESINLIIEDFEKDLLKINSKTSVDEVWHFRNAMRRGIAAFISTNQSKILSSNGSIYLQARINKVKENLNKMVNEKVKELRIDNHSESAIAQNVARRTEQTNKPVSQQPIEITVENHDIYPLDIVSMLQASDTEKISRTQAKQGNKSDSRKSEKNSSVKGEAADKLKEVPEPVQDDKKILSKLVKEYKEAKSKKVSGDKTLLHNKIKKLASLKEQILIVNDRIDESHDIIEETSELGKLMKSVKELKLFR